MSSDSAAIVADGSSASLLQGKRSSVNKLTARTKILLEKVVVLQLIGKIPRICGTRRLIPIYKFRVYQWLYNDTPFTFIFTLVFRPCLN